MPIIAQELNMYGQYVSTGQDSHKGQENARRKAGKKTIAGNQEQ